MLDRSRKHHLHVINRSASPSVFHITPEIYREACQRHPEAASVVEATFAWDGEGFAEARQSAAFLIGWDIPVADIAAGAPNLKWIHITGAGVEHLLPLTWLPPGVQLTNNKGVHAGKAGEFIAMAVLALNARVPFYHSSKQARRWERVFTSTIGGKTVVIVGMGNMGGAGARRCRELGLHVIGVARTAKDHPFADKVVTSEDLHAILPEADFLVLTVPLTAQTRGLIGERELDLLKPGAAIVNIARSGVMDYRALARKLESNAVSGAFLDVFDQEPLPPDSYLWDVPNLVITPHVSSDDAKTYVPRTLDLFFRNLSHLLAGDPLENRVEASLEY